MRLKYVVQKYNGSKEIYSVPQDLESALNEIERYVECCPAATTVTSIAPKLYELKEIPITVEHVKAHTKVEVAPGDYNPFTSPLDHPESIKEIDEVSKIFERGES